jgi:hypothetical protein
MPRTVPSGLAAHLAGSATTTCCLLKIKPSASSQATIFGLTTLDRDVVYDDGTGDGEITYRARRGYTPLDLQTQADLSIDNTEASGLVAEYPADGVTEQGVNRGDYDGARFVQYLINYEALSQGHTIINAGKIGQIKVINGQVLGIELRSLTQILKQNSLIELTSITNRARYGDFELITWYQTTVTAVGAESDRQFSVSTFAEEFHDIPIALGDGTTTAFSLVNDKAQTITGDIEVDSITVDGVEVGFTYLSESSVVQTDVPPPDGSIVRWSGRLFSAPTDKQFSPGVVHWLNGANMLRENEVEEFAVGATTAVTLMIPTREPIAVGDVLKIRRDSDGSKAQSIADNNFINFRGEPELPRANGLDLQSPTPSE